MNRYRSVPDFIPELDFVMEEDGKIIGQVMYSRAGFVPAIRLGIHYHSEPVGSEVPYFIAKELIPGYLDGIEGVYCPPKGYFVAEDEPEAFETYEATFPHKEKKILPRQIF
ncbi:MAG: hypothetical protein ACI39U_02015 [Candidatus Cryptobacteroides sp.]